MENKYKSFSFNLIFLAIFWLNISGLTLARNQQMIGMNELEKDQMFEKLEAYKKIIASAAAREVGLLKMVEGVLQECKKSGQYCNKDEDCCSKSCREDDEQEYYTGSAVCL